MRTPDRVEPLTDPDTGGIPGARKVRERTERIAGGRQCSDGVIRPNEGKVGIGL